MITEDLLKIRSTQGASSGDSSHFSQFTDDSSVVGGSRSIDGTIGSTSSESDDGISRVSVTPGGHTYYVPVCADKSYVPVENQIFDSLERGISFYKEYGRACGFNTRRTTLNKDDDGVIDRRYIVCSREGFNKEKPRPRGGSKVPRRRTVSSRCGCNARIVFKHYSGDSYIVSVFVEQHNHQLVSEAGRQFLRVNRQLSCQARKFVFDASRVNIGPSKSFTLMKEMVGGYANIGATVRDFRNFSRDMKAYVGERDAQMIIDKFKVKHQSCESFYYAYDVDSEGHLSKLFWSDSIARTNYALYGDAVSFDATFDTNMYNMVFCPFTGVDKYDKCVTFAFVLLSKEDIPNFQWAFDHFLKCMGRNPVLIITDQCPAMKQAIPLSFPATDEFPAAKHRLCMWHIMENFPLKVGNYLCKETDFMEQMKKYIWASNIEPFEFESGWNSVLKKFKLEGHRWLWEMYAIRKSWIPAFFRDEPMFGLLRSTSRSESENNFFSQFHRQSDTLCEFYFRFETAMDRQRYENERLNQEASCAIPTPITKLFIEADAAQLYTRPIFYKVQQEIVASCYDIRIQSIGPLVDGIKSYEMVDVRVKDKVFEVKVSAYHADCSCKQFVMRGILCSHAFCGLNHFMVTKIPRNLVLNRWCRSAEKKISACKLYGVSDDFFKMERVSVTTSNIWFRFQKIMNKSGVDLDKLDYVEKSVKQLDCELADDTLLSKKMHLEVLIGPQPSEAVTIQPPKQCVNKGSGLKRFVSVREKAIKGGGKKPRRCARCSGTNHDARTCLKMQESMQQQAVDNNEEEE